MSSTSALRNVFAFCLFTAPYAQPMIVQFSALIFKINTNSFAYIRLWQYAVQYYVLNKDIRIGFSIYFGQRINHLKLSGSIPLA